MSVPCLLRCLTSGLNQAKSKIKDSGLFQKLCLSPGWERTWIWDPAIGRGSRWAESRPVARPQRAMGGGRPLATSTQGKAKGGDAVCNTHKAMAQAAISRFIESDCFARISN